MMLPKRQYEMHIPLGDGIHVVCRRSRASTESYQTAKNEEK
jgi:hypothetical protein